MAAPRLQRRGDAATEIGFASDDSVSFAASALGISTWHSAAGPRPRSLRRHHDNKMSDWIKAGLERGYSVETGARLRYMRTKARPVLRKAAVPATFHARRFFAEIAANVALAALLALASVVGATRFALLGSTTLGAYVVHPYVLGDMARFLWFLKRASTWPAAAGDAAQCGILLGLPAVFLVVLGPPANALLLAPLRAGARAVCSGALRAPAPPDDADECASPKEARLHLL